MDRTYLSAQMFYSSVHMATPIPNTILGVQEAIDQKDRELAALGVTLIERGATLILRMADDWDVPVALTDGAPPEHDTLVEGVPLREIIRSWQEARYGRRLKAHLGPGRMVLDLRGDPWCVRFPLIYGRPEVDLLDWIEDLTIDLRRTLTEQECVDIGVAIRAGGEALQQAYNRWTDPLMARCLAGHESTVGFLMNTQPHFDLARYSASEAAEKALKAFMRAKGQAPAKTHQLRALADSAESSGLPSVSAQLTQDAQATADMRYGDDGVTYAEAVSAHHAALAITGIVAAELPPTPTPD